MILLNYRDARPLYAQVKDELRRLIESGAIAEGEKLPSVRQLAAQLAINPNTIQRAMNELEAEGYAVTRPGSGSFAVRPQQHAEELEDRLRAALAALRAAGVSEEEIGRICAEGRKL